MPRGWLSIRVELVQGRGLDFWPRPGRLIAAAAAHTFAAFAQAIDTSFARWDRSHLYAFEFPDGMRVGSFDPNEDDPEEIEDSAAVTLSRLRQREPFVYVFDFGDEWTHLCTVNDEPIDPVEEFGRVPRAPLPYFEWGDIPDQYGRRWEQDDGETEPPLNPGKADLPPLRPRWGRSEG